jgi:flagellar biosynthesis protein FliR
MPIAPISGGVNTSAPSPESNVPSTENSLPDNLVRTFVYALAALFLLGLSKILPTTAALLAISITIGVLFKNNKQFTVVVNRINTAFGIKTKK